MTITLKGVEDKLALITKLRILT